MPIFAMRRRPVLDGLYLGRNGHHQNPILAKPFAKVLDVPPIYEMVEVHFIAKWHATQQFLPMDAMEMVLAALKEDVVTSDGGRRRLLNQAKIHLDISRGEFAVHDSWGSPITFEVE